MRVFYTRPTSWHRSLQVSIDHEIEPVKQVNMRYATTPLTQ